MIDEDDLCNFGVWVFFFPPPNLNSLLLLLETNNPVPFVLTSIPHRKTETYFYSFILTESEQVKLIFL